MGDSVRSFEAPWRGIIGASSGEAPLVLAVKGRTAGTMNGEETTMVEGE